MCTLLEVGRASYYDWLIVDTSVRRKETQNLVTTIKRLFIESRCTYGSRRLRAALKQLGFSISRRRIGKIMKKEQLSCKTKRKFRMTTDSKHKHAIAPNLLERDFVAHRANQKYVGDITYIYTREGWLYLAVVIDLFSRKIIGWSMKEHMRDTLVNDALLMAVWQRKPKAGLIWHTDRGSQYASNSHRQILAEHGIRQSMSRKGNCWDNAVSESFFHTLKTELTYHFNFKTKEEAKRSIFEYIEVFYNRKRLHSANDYYSPVEYELRRKTG